MWPVCMGVGKQRGASVEAGGVEQACSLISGGQSAAMMGAAASTLLVLMVRCPRTSRSYPRGGLVGPWLCG